MQKMLASHGKAQAAMKSPPVSLVVERRPIMRSLVLRVARPSCCSLQRVRRSPIRAGARQSNPPASAAARRRLHPLAAGTPARRRRAASAGRGTCARQPPPAPRSTGGQPPRLHRQPAGPPWRAEADAAARRRHPATAAGGDAGAGDADRVGDRTEPRPARRIGGGPMGCGAGRVEHSARVDDAAVAEVPRRDELRSRVHREVRDSGQLQRLPDLRHLDARRSPRWC